MNPEVRGEITRVMGYWLELGVSGFRMDAVPFLIEKKGADAPFGQDFELLHELRDFLQWRSKDGILLAEANVPPEESASYFGSHGDHLQMMLNFPVNQRLFYGMATGDLEPLKWALEATRLLRSPRRSGCSSTTAGSAAGSRRCSATIAACSSSPSACCSHCRARP
jgi:maltose alpha-D-glucosyltransferase/alpha-amylase